MSRKVVVIGGGPAGLEAARAAAEAGAQVTLVSNAPLGGRAIWHGLLPSKVWLTLADSLGQLSQAEMLGALLTGTPEVDPPLVLERIREIARAWHHEQDVMLQDLGVTFILGEAEFVGPHRLHVSAKMTRQRIEIEADAFIVATGSLPIFPHGIEPDGERILAPRFAKHLEKLPETVVIMGAGATGCEFAYLFSRLGVGVKWLYEESNVLPEIHREAGALLGSSLSAWGAQLLPERCVVGVESDRFGISVIANDGERHFADAVFVAMGRRPHLSPLKLDTIGLPATDDAPPPTDAYGRTSLEHVYLIGDAAGPPMTANRAMSQGRVAGRHAAQAHTPTFRPETIVFAVYTDPALAQVGQVQGAELAHVRLPLTELLKARLTPEATGFFELSFNALDGRVRGAVAIGPQAGEMVLPVAQAIQLRATVSDLASLYPAHPTAGEIACLAARRAAAWRD